MWTTKTGNWRKGRKFFKEVYSNDVEAGRDIHSNPAWKNGKFLPVHVAKAMFVCEERGKVADTADCTGLSQRILDFILERKQQLAAAEDIAEDEAARRLFVQIYPPIIEHIGKQYYISDLREYFNQICRIYVPEMQ